MPFSTPALSSSLLLQHGRSDSYRVATVPSIPDDNKTFDGAAKVLIQALLTQRQCSRGVLKVLIFLLPSK